MRTFVVAQGLVLVLAACAPPPRSDTVRICSDAGCALQPVSTETFRPGTDASADRFTDPDAYRGEDVAALEEAARAGDAAAAYRLGLVHLHGLAGVRRSPTAAARYFRQGADAAHAGSQRMLGELHLAGTGVPRRPEEGARLLRVAAEQGDPLAAHDLAALLAEGELLPADPAEAARWCELAAKQGVPAAQYDLGLMHFRGQGVPQNGFVAMRWLREAARNGHAEAQLALGRLYLSGYETVGQDVTEAERWLHAAAAQGNRAAAGLLKEVEKLKAENRAFERELALKRQETDAYIAGLGLASTFRPRWRHGYP